VHGNAFGFVPLNRVSTFQINTNGAGAGQVKAVITGILLSLSF
jgi:hypothetical protein